MFNSDKIQMYFLPIITVIFIIYFRNMMVQMIC